MDLALPQNKEVDNGKGAPADSRALADIRPKYLLQQFSLIRTKLSEGFPETTSQATSKGGLSIHFRSAGNAKTRGLCHLV